MSIFERRQNAPTVQPVVAGERDDLGEAIGLGALEGSEEEQTPFRARLGDLPPPPMRGAFAERVSCAHGSLSPRGGGPVEEAAAQPWQMPQVFLHLSCFLVHHF